MVSKKPDTEMINELFEIIASLKSAEECRGLFTDMCTLSLIHI